VNRHIYIIEKVLLFLFSFFRDRHNLNPGKTEHGFIDFIVGLILNTLSLNTSSSSINSRVVVLCVDVIQVGVHHHPSATAGFILHIALL